MSWVLALPILIPFMTAVLAFLLRGSRMGDLASVAGAVASLGAVQGLTLLLSLRALRRSGCIARSR